MPNPAWRKVFQHLRRSALVSDGTGLSDAQLLDRFLTDADEDAFAALVRRHGPMVFGVCRRLLPGWQDAEDAFQATFLVLARKAATIQPRHKVGNWLYGVAHRTALEAKTILAKQRARERSLQDVAQPEPVDESEPWRELQPLLDAELNRLPDKYRTVIVCCDLQGKTRKEAARQLGWPEGTVAARLARGRSLLRARLMQRGLPLSVGSLTTLLTDNGASACVSKSLEVCTVKAATVCAAGTTMAPGLVSAHVAILTQGVLKSMLFTKLKFAAGLLVVLGVIGFGTGVGMYAGGTQPLNDALPVSGEHQQSNLDEGLKSPSETNETDRANVVKELEDRKRAEEEEDGRESKKKIEKKKRRHEEDEDEEDEDRDSKKVDKKKRGHEEDEDDDDDGRESKKKAGIKQRGHEDEDDDEREGKKKAGASKREHDDDKEKGREAKKAGKKKREREEEEDDGREHARKKKGVKKREREDDEERREIEKNANKKSRRQEDEEDRREGVKKAGKKKRHHEDDEREGKKKAKKAKRRYEDDDDNHARKDKRKVERKNRRHEDEDDDDRREGKKAGKKKRQHEDDEDDEREGKKRRRHKGE